MVGRLSVAPLLLLVMAALTTAPPATAEPQRLLIDLLEPLADFADSTDFADSAASLDSTTSHDSAAAYDSGAIDPTEAAVPALAALPPSAVPAVFGDPAPDSGEVGVEYQLSVRAATPFLDRLSARFKRLVEQAMTYLGTPYRLGGTSRRGLDCSGLVGAVYGEQGLDLPRTAAQQFGEGMAVAESDLRPGDLVFFRDTYKRGISHVGIYIGDGRFLHAAGRRHGVIVSELSRLYYRSRYAGARRPAGELAAAGRQSGGQSPTDRAADSTRATAPRR